MSGMKACIANICLPVSLLELILAYAQENVKHTNTRRFYDNYGTRPGLYGPKYLKELHRFASVCRTWNATAIELYERLSSQIMTMSIREGTQEEFEKFCALVRSKSSTIRELSMVFGTFDLTRSLLVDDQLLVNLSTANIKWDRLFMSCSRLRRLDLSKVPMGVLSGNILEQASNHCRQIKSLIMPMDHMSWREPKQAVTKSLCKALRRWYSYVSNSMDEKRGLIHLGLPAVGISFQLLHAVASYCPFIEYLDGFEVCVFQLTESDHDPANRSQCRDIWRQFCDSCTNIKEIAWGALPNLDIYLDMFSKKSKYSLEKLRFEVRSSDLEHANELEDTHVSINTLTNVIHCCPVLRELRLHLISVDTTDSFDDAFLLEIAQICPLLEDFVLWEQTNIHIPGTGIDQNHDLPQGLITDAGLVALSQSLPSLRNLTILGTTQTTGGGIFDFIANNVQDYALHRFTTRLDPTESIHRPIDVLCELLDLLVDANLSSMSPLSMKTTYREPKSKFIIELRTRGQKYLQYDVTSCDHPTRMDPLESELLRLQRDLREYHSHISVRVCNTRETNGRELQKVFIYSISAEKYLFL